MKRLIIEISLVLTIFCLACGQANQQTQATADSASAEQELMQMEQDLINAYLEQDVASLDRLLADDYIATGDDGSLSTKAEGISNLESGVSVPSSIVVKDMKARVWGDAGVVWSGGVVTSQSEGNETSSQSRHTTTWVKITGNWQAVAGHASNVASN